MPKSSYIWISITLVLGTLVCISPAIKAESQRVLKLSISDQLSSCPSALPLPLSHRITFRFPHKIQVAVPSVDHTLQVHLSQNIAVVQAHPHLHSSKMSSNSDPVSLSIILENKQTVHCRFILSKSGSASSLNSLKQDQPLIEFVYVGQLKDDLNQSRQFLKHLEHTLYEESSPSSPSLEFPVEFEEIQRRQKQILKRYKTQSF